LVIIQIFFGESICFKVLFSLLRTLPKLVKSKQTKLDASLIVKHCHSFKVLFFFHRTLSNLVKSKKTELYVSLIAICFKVLYSLLRTLSKLVKSKKTELDASLIAIVSKFSSPFSGHCLSWSSPRRRSWMPA
jgi:hypothetical protein